MHGPIPTYRGMGNSDSFESREWGEGESDGNRVPAAPEAEAGACVDTMLPASAPSSSAGVWAESSRGATAVEADGRDAAIAAAETEVLCAAAVALDISREAVASAPRPGTTPILGTARATSDELEPTPTAPALPPPASISPATVASTATASRASPMPQLKPDSCDSALLCSPAVDGQGKPDSGASAADEGTPAAVRVG